MRCVPSQGDGCSGCCVHPLPCPNLIRRSRRPMPGDYGSGSSSPTRHPLRAWVDGRVAIGGSSQQDAFHDRQSTSAASRTATPTANRQLDDPDGNSSAESNSYGYSYGYTDFNANCDTCAIPERNRHQRARTANRGPYLDRRDWKHCGHLPQQCVAREHTERRCLHRYNKWRWAWHLHV